MCLFLPRKTRITAMFLQLFRCLSLKNLEFRLRNPALKTVPGKNTNQTHFHSDADHWSYCHIANVSETSPWSVPAVHSPYKSTHPHRSRHCPRQVNRHTLVASAPTHSQRLCEPWTRCNLNLFVCLCVCISSVELS